ncbi:MAG: linear amide C-N hydrolase [Muribaculaceae bacterium]|nr:linear amide C-N hydrolase [Muribaculaceae bacterium]
MNTISRIIGGAALAGAAVFGVAADADACSRILYEGTDSLYVVARSLDWKTPIPTNLYVYPRGIRKVSSDQPDAISWTSKYGAVYAVGYDGGITEGMNEKGLVINGLFCKGTVYGNEETAKRPPMSMAMFVGWLLDLNATTDEVVKVLEEQNFNIGGATFDEGTVSQLHWGVTDATGKSIIFEFDHGKVRVYDMGDYRAMTNDPQWPAMKAIIDYWNNIGGKNMLPGTVSSPDRCVRANYFAHHVKPVGEADLGVSIARSVLLNSSVPYTYEIEGAPNLSSTQWRSYSDLRDLRYYFDIVTNPGYYYVDLKEVDLRPGAPILKLDTSARDSKEYVGDVSKHFKKNPGFTPMY